MEGNNWRAQGEPSMADSSSGGGAWRTHLPPEARQRIVNKIMETLKRHLPISVPEGLNELKKIAVRFEEKIYTAATNQSDYLRKISLKMLSMETKAQPSPPLNQTMSNSSVVNQNPADPGSLSVQSQGNNPGQPLAVPNRQSLLPQNLQNSSSAAPALPSISGLSQTMSGVTQGSNMQNMPGISQSSVNNSAGQIAQSDIYASAQRQMQERAQQQMLSQQQQQQQPQNQLLYQRQLQQQIMNKKLQQSSLMQAHMQQQQQQQLPPGQLQSTLQTNQSNMQQTQAANSQLASQSGLQQNQLNQIQQSASSLLQQNPQYVGRQPQAQQTSIQQQSILIPHQSTLTQQHQLMGQQGNMSSMQQNPLLGQQNNMSDIQQKQQRLQTMQQNNLLSMQQQPQLMNQQTMPLHQQQQQQLGSQSNMGGIQQQQHQLLGSLPSVSTMQPHQRAMMMQKNATQQQQQQQQQQLQQQTQQSSLALSQSQGQGQQSQHQSSQQQLMSQFQSQPSQLQQQMLLQQQSNSLQREMQQRLVSGNLLQSQNPLEQKPFIQQQRGLPEVSSSTSMDSTAQTGHAGAIDAQEEAYQKIKSMKELYFADLSEFHQKVAMKLQQQEQHLPPGKQSDQFKKLEAFKQMLEKLLHLLQIPKSSIPHNMKDKLVVYEKQMQSMIASHRTKKIPPAQQQQFQHANAGNSQPIPQQQQSSQVVQTQLPDKHQNSVQQINLPGNSLQSGGASSLQHMPMPLPTTQQNLSNTIQPSSNMDSIQVGSFSSGQPGAVGSGHQGGMGSLQNSLSAPQQSNSNTLSQSTVNTLQVNVGSMQPGSNVLQQQQQMNQEQQQLKQQFQHRQMQQQIYQHQQRQILQQQPLQQHLQQQQQQQQTPQLPVHQVQQQQLHSMNEPNEMKLRQGSGIKTALHEYTAGQRLNYYNQQQKQGAAFPVSSPQNLQASSPQISHHSSPQIDQNGLLSSIPKVKAQSANSPLVVTPSTPFAPSPILVDSDKNVPSIPSTLVHPQSSAPSAQPHSLAVSTPGISASPLLAECISQDGNQANLPATSRASATERPLERLIRAVQKTAPKVLISSVEDIESVVSMIDRIAGSAPGNGSRTAVGEELVAMTKCRLQARNFMSQDGGATAKKMKRHTSAMPLNNVSSAGSGNDSFKKLHGFESSELESTATSRVKRLKPEVNHTLLEEIEEINQKLIDSVVEVSDDDTDSVAAAASEGGEGTVIKCSYTAVALSPDLKAHFSAAQMSPIMPLRLLVPTSYPKCSPVLVDKLSVEPSGEFEDLSSQAMSKLSISLRGLSQPMSLGEMVRAWDACSRKVILEYAQRHGGGSFSTTYGSWENCISTA